MHKMQKMQKSKVCQISNGKEIWPGYITETNKF